MSITTETAAGRAPRPAAGTIRVASVPSGHVYPRHVRDLDDAVSHLPDPPPAVARPLVGQWWPPVMLDPGWIRAHAAEFDVLHLHFGFDALDPGQLREVVRALRDTGRPLVYTVHDLRNPHHVDRAAHDAHLDVLVPAADALITLTDGAAGEIERRWGRRPTVLPHPHVLPAGRLGQAPDRDRDRFVVGLHLKSLRPSMAPLPVLRGLLDVIDELDGAELLLDAHPDVVSPSGARFDAAVTRAVEQAAQHPRVRVHVHDCYTDDELWSYLRGLDLSVLPYRFGTHSGWLEACRDLGTDVLAPTCGHLHTQRPCFAYRHDESGLDVASLQDAVRAAWRERPRRQAGRGERLAERAAVARAHRDVYRQVA